MKCSITNRIRNLLRSFKRKWYPLSWKILFFLSHSYLMCTGNYYDLNSHKIPILDFVQQMVSEKRGGWDTLRWTRCDGGGSVDRSIDPRPGRGDEDAVAVGKIILERMSSAIKSKNQSNYMTSTHRFMIFSSSFCQGLTLCIYSLLVLPLLFGAMFLCLQIIPETEGTNRLQTSRIQHIGCQYKMY